MYIYYVVAYAAHDYYRHISCEPKGLAAVGPYVCPTDSENLGIWARKQIMRERATGE